jgi:hypothetical protein
MICRELNLAALQPLRHLALLVSCHQIEGIADMERIAFRYQEIMDELHAGN